MTLHRLRWALITTMLALLLGGTAHAEDGPPGARYTLPDGRAMHLWCAGDAAEGQPTVLLEAGIGGFSLNWAWVLPELATTTRVCAYDRAGYGWSDAHDGAFTLGRALDDLDALLAVADITGPFVVGAHSFGAVLSRAFQARHPDDVLGMVLLDAVHEDLVRAIPTYPDAQAAQFASLRLLAIGARLGGVALGDANIPTGVPDAYAATYTARLLEPSFLNTSVAEAQFMVGALAEAALPQTLGALPLIVLAHGVPETLSFLGAPMTRAQAADAEAAWQGLQARLAALSALGELRVAEDSGHNIQFDQPELVAAALRDVLAAVRAGAR